MSRTRTSVNTTVQYPPQAPSSSSTRRLFYSDNNGIISRNKHNKTRNDSSSSKGRKKNDNRHRSRGRSRKKHSGGQNFDQQHSSSVEDEPLHELKITTGSDDISSADVVSCLSEQTYDFDDSCRQSERSYSSSPDHFFGYNNNSNNNTENHRRNQNDDNDTTNKTCLPGGFFWRSKSSRKVSCADVASVGNASDTLISVSSKAHMSGRDLHESAKVSLNVGEMPKALSMFESILDAQIQRFGPIHPSVGAAVHNVGVVWLRMGQSDYAESLFEESVKIRRQTLGPDHLELAASLSKLGTARVALKKFDEGLDNLREALRIARLRVGEQHKTVAQILCKMACLFFEAGELLASQHTFTDALDIYRAVWVRDNDRDACMSQLTDTLCNVGSIQNKRKQFSHAIITFSEALDLQRGILGHDDTHVIATLDNLAYSHSKNKDYTLASSCYKDMIQAQISHYGTFSKECLDTLKKQTLMFEKLKDPVGAIEVTNEALRLQRSMLSHDNEIIKETDRILEGFTIKKNKIAEKTR